MGQDHFDLSRFTPFLLNRTGSIVASRFSELLKKYDVDIIMWRLMAALNQQGRLRIGQLADFTTIELWTVSRVLTKLEKKELIQRVRVGDDARAVEVSLTSKGAALIAEIIPHARRFETIPLTGFTPEEIDQLHSLLNRLFSNLDSESSPAVRP